MVTVATDLDGDGKIDMINPNRNANNISVFRNTGSGGTISFAANAGQSTVAPHLFGAATIACFPDPTAHLLRCLDIALLGGHRL